MNIIHYLRKKYGIETKVDHYYTLTITHNEPLDERETIQAAREIKKILEKHPTASVYVAQNMDFRLKETDNSDPFIEFPKPDSHAMFFSCGFYHDITDVKVLDLRGN